MIRGNLGCDNGTLSFRVPTFWKLHSWELFNESLPVTKTGKLQYKFHMMYMLGFLSMKVMFMLMQMILELHLSVTHL